jgi:hypothetical protein
MNQRL